MKQRKINLLVSAYACEPSKGSEPEVGWMWVLYLSKYHHVHVVTRSNNRSSIEKHIRKEDKKNLTFHYLDFPEKFQNFKKKYLRGSWGISLYYILWQQKLSCQINDLVVKNKIDIVHHLTIATYRLPFGIQRAKCKKIIGPVGGCETYPWRLMPKYVWRVILKESIRNLLIKSQKKLNWLRSSDLVIASTSEMYLQLQSLMDIPLELMQTIGAKSEPFRPKKREPGKGLKLLYAGKIIYWKGLELAILGMKLLPQDVTLTCFGNGENQRSFENLARRCGVADRVFFKGQIDRDELISEYSRYDVFLYPSLHDSGSFTILEAMRAGLPIVCLDRGGPAMSVTKDCGVIVDSSGSKMEVVNRLHNAVLKYYDNDELIRSHGESAMSRVRDEFDWERKAAKMNIIYQKVLDGQTSK